MLRSIRTGVAACALLVMTAGCGDAPTSDTRGYTKAPLETLGVFIQSEVRSDVREFARFNIPDGQRTEPPAEAAGS